MNHVSVTSIEKAIEKVDNLDDDALEKLAETYTLAQNSLISYALDAANEYDNPQLEGLIMYYFCLISEAFTQEQIRTKEVSDDDIEAFQEDFFEMLDDYFNKENEDIVFEFTDQPTLVQFMMVELSTPDDDGTQLDDETATQLFIVSTAIIALLNRAA